MRKALVVGVNYYEGNGSLFGCVDDAHSMKPLLEYHGDGKINFDVKILTGTGPTDQVYKGELKDSLDELFRDDPDVALFYFAGHGHIDSAGGYILASDAKRADDGLTLDQLLILANNSKARNKIIILDSCHSGLAGSQPGHGSNSGLSEGLTILTASTKDQYATEKNGQGVFTSLVVDALQGAAADLAGHITPGSVYAHVDQSLGSWEQRPIFKTNVKTFVSLREVPAPVSLEDLRRLIEFFPKPGAEFKLDPSFEPEMKGRDTGMPQPKAENTRTFAILQKLNRVNLVVPVGAPHMWNAAMESKSCRLTGLGEHYRRLIERKRL